MLCVLSHILFRPKQDGASMARMSNEQRERKALQELLLSGPYSRSQLFLSETLARLHPELTIPMFSGENIGLLFQL